MKTKAEKARDEFMSARDKADKLMAVPPLKDEKDEAPE